MRSRLVNLMLLGVAAALLPGHSPYRQWYAYRAAHLVVVTDPDSPLQRIAEEPSFRALRGAAEYAVLERKYTKN